MASEDSGHEDRSVLERPSPPPAAQWSYGPDPDQVADVYPAAHPSGAPVVLVHGGFWRPEYDRMHLRPLASDLAGAGHPVLSLEYRRVPGDPGVAVADLLLALDRLRGEPPAGWPSTPSTVIGHSAGGHLALLLAASGNPSIDAVVALAPVADLRQAEQAALDGDAVVAFLGGPASTRPELDPTAREPAVPVTIVHGDADAIVPIALTQSYSKAHPSVRVVALPETGHFALVDPRSDAFAQLLSLLAATGIEWSRPRHEESPPR
jgi:acetyl esterase/lipase